MLLSTDLSCCLEGRFVAQALAAILDHKNEGYTWSERTRELKRHCTLSALSSSSSVSVMDGPPPHFYAPNSLEINSFVKATVETLLLSDDLRIMHDMQLYK